MDRIGEIWTVLYCKHRESTKQLEMFRGHLKVQMHNSRELESQSLMAVHTNEFDRVKRISDRALSE